MIESKLFDPFLGMEKQHLIQEVGEAHIPKSTSRLKIEAKRCRHLVDRMEVETASLVGSDDSMRHRMESDKLLILSLSSCFASLAIRDVEIKDKLLLRDLSKQYGESPKPKNQRRERRPETTATEVAGRREQREPREDFPLY
ncbi:hypothetical protein V6N13_064842 [Hibiscus sabdariffa]|uniref:Uncharacterized protein n=1 Tax=Hibiscus sabdariffa TaxID=183260 RepID=A0ABR1ZCQ0_9ROSI